MTVTKLQELVPLYINGAMSENDRRVFAQALKQNSILKQEYKEFYELDSLLSNSENVDLKQLELLFKNIEFKPVTPIPKTNPAPAAAAVVRTETVNRPTPKIERDFQDYDDDYQPEKFSKEYFLYILSSPKVAWAIIALQFILLSLLVVIKLPHTLNTNSQIQSEAKMVNVVFADTATQKEIRELLVDIKAQIANGPTSIGLYTIYFRATDQQAGLVIDKLKKSKFILLAEPAFAGNQN